VFCAFSYEENGTHMTRHIKVQSEAVDPMSLSTHRPTNGQSRREGRRPLQVMKFGGTSVADAACIAKVVEIIRAASLDSSLVVVVSAMNGVTNDLIEAARRSEAGNRSAALAIFEKLRNQHQVAINTLIQSPAERDRLGLKMQELFREADRLCQGTTLIRELTLRASDSICSIGERLSAPLIAVALSERGLQSEAVEATELVVTDSNHGAAEPKMDLTSERCQNRLRSFLQHGGVPVVTGFIGATEEGVLTTLGRGGSDYSATILGAALHADGVIIWKEVDGLLTADPRLVPGTCTISEISYREAAELAYFGAKVLHPKTLRAVMQFGIPLWIRNTFAPDRPGTKITPTSSCDGRKVKALTAISDVALVTLGGPGIAGTPHVLERTLAAITASRGDALLVLQSSSQNDICLVVPSSMAKRTVESLRFEFARELEREKNEHINQAPTVAIVTKVAQNMRSLSGIVGRTFGALGRENINIIAIAQGSSECSISFVVARKELRAALITAHREFQLSETEFTRASSSSDGAPLSVATGVI
jgi:aspartokinase/homoserine dehydrogenase 1